MQNKEVCRFVRLFVVSFTTAEMEYSMTGAGTYIAADPSGWADAESHIGDVLAQTAEELAHTECFDQEQRAEIYAILQALKTDTSNHRQMVQLLAGKLRDRSAGDA